MLANSDAISMRYSFSSDHQSKPELRYEKSLKPVLRVMTQTGKELTADTCASFFYFVNTAE